MAEIHHTTLVPGKLELLTGWLPQQSWYEPPEAGPQLARAGGFRLDDPAGEVGIELMIVTDAGGPEPASYLVPLSYRGAPAAALDDALIGTAEHGVLGRRWIYDGARDPVVLAQLTALLRGDCVAQAQSESFQADPSVEVRPVDPSDRDILVTVKRRLSPESASDERVGRVVTGWQLPDGTACRGVLVSAG